MTLAIRRYEDRDSAAVVRLHRTALEDAGGYLPGPWDADFDDIAGVYLAPGGEFLVGELEGEIVAMGALRRLDADSAEVKRMRVDPAHQGCGYGRALLNQLEEIARALGITRLTLDTTEVQTAAQRLYERSGYRRTGRATFGSFEMLLYEKTLAVGPASGTPDAAAQ